jgi:general secretion pathway protein E
MHDLIARWRERMEYEALKIPDASVIDIESMYGWAASEGIDRDQLCKTLVEVVQVNWAESLTGYSPVQEYIAQFPISFSRRHKVIGLRDAGGAIRLVIGDARSWSCLDTVGRSLGCEVLPIFARRADILKAIDTAYEAKSSQTESVIQRLENAEIDVDLTGGDHGHDLLDSSDRAPVIQLVNSVLFDAVRHRASDVHIQPYADHLQIRFRIDGMLFDQFKIQKSRQDEVLSRLKIIGKMNIAEKRMPQDGRATVRVGQRIIDMRIASLPASHGERIVLRLLDKSARLYTLNELGMNDAILDQFRRLIHLEHGIILVTGPTGGGKSTTLYAALQELNAKEFNIVTLEDPIEYQLDGISQTQINEKKGMTFANGLRSVLRQDPDVIMVGEIRDEDTAKMAIQSALTGHLVFSTLHTNDAASAVTRLLDLGIEPYLVASSVVGVLAQRLVRENCTNCKAVDISQLVSLRSIAKRGQELPDHLARGAGCDRCRETGYFGRIGLFELMMVDDEIRRLIQARANASEIRSSGVARGMGLLRADGIEKVIAGRTTVEEVLRVSQASPGEVAIEV